MGLPLGGHRSRSEGLTTTKLLVNYLHNMKHKTSSKVRKETNVEKIARLNWNAFTRLMFRLTIIENAQRRA